MAAGPTQRTLQRLRKHGVVAGVVERWNQYAKIRQDLFGFIDIIALERTAPAIIAIQCTSASNHASRVTKVLNEPRTWIWLACGGRIQVWSWRKTKIGKRVRWVERVSEIAPKGGVHETVESETGKGQTKKGAGYVKTDNSRPEGDNG